MTERLSVDGLRLWLGAVFTDKEGKKWVFTGLADSEEHGIKVAVFHPANETPAWPWLCAYRDALEAKFVNLPDLKYGKVEETGWGEYEMRRQMNLGKPIMQEHCRIETDRQCGCGFGQCARGLIY